MALRLIEIFLPSGEAEKVREFLHQDQPCEFLDVWVQSLEGGRTSLKLLINTEEVDRVLDFLQEKLSPLSGYRVALLPVLATLPRPEPPSPEAANRNPTEPENNSETAGRISREELYSSVADGGNLTKTYMVLVVLSSVVAAIGLVRNDLAVIIGAMVIAPLLGPNMALVLGTTLGDSDLMRRSLRVNLAGISTAVMISVLLGLSFSVSATIPAIASRTEPRVGDVALALAAGGAGALSFTVGVPTVLVGVMVAVALLPPLVVFGLLVGSAHWPQALGALLLTLTNLICINLAGIVTFVIQGIRPTTWWEINRAKRATRLAILSWSLLLVMLVLVILVSYRT